MLFSLGGVGVAGRSTGEEGIGMALRSRMGMNVSYSCGWWPFGRVGAGRPCLDRRRRPRGGDTGGDGEGDGEVGVVAAGEEKSESAELGIGEGSRRFCERLRVIATEGDRGEWEGREEEGGEGGEGERWRGGDDGVVRGKWYEK